MLLCSYSVEAFCFLFFLQILVLIFYYPVETVFFLFVALAFGVSKNFFEVEVNLVLKS